MAVKTFALLCLQVLLIKVIAAYPCSPCAGLQSTGLYTPNDLAATSGGLLIVTSGSPIAPTGISVLSENIIEGVLSVEGILPFLGTVSLEGEVPTVGTGTVAYGCGNGNKFLCQVITNAPYYTNAISTNGVNGVIGNGMVPNNLAMTSGLSTGPIYSGIPGEAAISAAEATTIATNAANTAAFLSNINGGCTGFEGFSLGGLPISGVSPYGDVTLAGELPVGGSTAVVGNVPVIGYVTFEGTIPAGGTVTLASNCGCSNPTI
ncbi:unnamed protein product [Parnassius apollo]|uniref:(apollo) hypothetical protein n=1 Tax=Parnassius apollo TaxID=110799 RepID=A0A8S3WFA6_PARAO|nr:unnamed protein product [Parnassius apollo]